MNAIEVSHLRIEDSRNGEVLVKDFSFALEEHRCLALVGESGSGKSMTVKAISGIHKPWIKCTGSILFEGKNMLEETPRRLREIRGKDIFMIFQDGMSAFDPSVSIRNTMREILMENIGGTRANLDELIDTAMKKVLFDNPGLLLDKFPHQLSGGMLQRIMIALSLALKPQVIIADEPTTALDTVTQFEVVRELIQVKEALATSMIFISHDLGIVHRIADYVVVVRNGEKVEEGPVETILTNPREEYTRYLVSARRALGDHLNSLTGGC